MSPHARPPFLLVVSREYKNTPKPEPCMFPYSLPTPSTHWQQIEECPRAQSFHCRVPTGPILGYIYIDLYIVNPSEINEPYIESLVQRLRNVGGSYKHYYEMPRNAGGGIPSRPLIYIYIHTYLYLYLIIHISQEKRANGKDN